MRRILTFLPHILGVILVFGIGYYIYLHYHFQPKPIKIVYDNIFLDESTEVAQEVYISGAIHNPGEYLMSPGSTLNDLVNQAGGLTKEADLSTINLGQLIENNQINIPYAESDTGGSQSDNLILENLINPNITNLININTASKEKLTSLPGIGEKTATKIIEHRQTTPFKTIQDIMQVNGIGEAKYNSIKDLITI